MQLRASTACERRATLPPSKGLVAALARSFGMWRQRKFRRLQRKYLVFGRFGERTAAAMRHMAETGTYIGGQAPFGYCLVDGQLRAYDAEQAVIRAARDLREQGLSLRAVAARLDGTGFRSRIGRVFAAVQVRRMVAP